MAVSAYCWPSPSSNRVSEQEVFMTGRAAILTAAALALGLLVAPSQGGQKDQKEKSANPPQTEKQKSSERRSSAPCEMMPILGDEGDPSALLQETLALLPDKQAFESVRRELENAREQLEQTGFTLAGDLDAAFGDHSAAMKELERVQAELVN